VKRIVPSIRTRHSCINLLARIKIKPKNHKNKASLYLIWHIACSGHTPPLLFIFNLSEIKEYDKDFGCLKEVQQEISLVSWAVAQFGWPFYTTLEVVVQTSSFTNHVHVIKGGFSLCFGQRHKLGRQCRMSWLNSENYKLLYEKSLDRGITYGSLLIFT